ncbi:CRISPR-associated protein Cas4 [uncultured Bacteroides sp.]|uniref:CRISPR-associated protein Cas4 n=1 Tax=uncultured Bacteroides sp. TaxID=162156 RepID=UPI00280C30F2|nr:CRISPR-associated protein Cas4 [uncultured Bacteroides sp.]
MEYDDENMLMLSGIQHFMFCPRQWGLIHLSQEWEDNSLTTEGQLLHKRVDSPFYRQKNGDIITLRSVHVASSSLGLYGVTDVVELSPSDSLINAIKHPHYPGFWHLLPIEYKRGKQKPNKCDEVQLAAQVICLEEMYQIRLDYGALYYHEVRRRDIIHIDDGLRELTQKCANQMHVIFSSRQIPRAIYQPHCKRCSLYDICLPLVGNMIQASTYLKKNLYEEIA